MSDGDNTMASHDPPEKKKPLLKAEDFAREERDPETVRCDMELPNIDTILKELQEKHGVRISLGPSIVRRLEEIKTQSKTAADDPTTLGIGCSSSDTCILCDTTDYCSTCDVSDWCVTVDTH